MTTEIIECLGYFAGPGEASPAFTPGADMPCPVCGQPLGKIEEGHVLARSLMLKDATRSYFFYYHTACRQGEEAIQQFEWGAVEEMERCERLQ